jgi:hypothetical protein
MTGFFRLTTGLLAFAIATSTPQISMADPGLTGPLRNTYVESLFKACLQKQTGDPENKGIAVDILAQLCICYADRVADQLNNDDLNATAPATDRAAIEAKLQRAIQQSSQTCLAKFRN